MNNLEIFESATENVNELWIHALNNNTEAFAMLIKKTERVLVRFAMSLGASFEDAEDVIQDSWFKACKAKHLFRSGENFYPWMFRIIRNRYIDSLRKKNRQIKPIVYENHEDLPNVNQNGYFDLPWYINIEEQLQTGAAEIILELQSHIIKLTRDNAMVLLLRIRDGKSTEEVADTLKKATSTIRWNMSECRRKISLKIHNYE